MCVANCIFTLGDYMITRPIDSDELKWLGVDFDKTIAHSEHPDYHPTHPLEGAVEALQELHKQGWKIIIFTARASSEYRLIESFLEDHNIPFKMIVCGKLLCRYYIDDRNVAFDGDWGKVLHTISLDNR